MGVVLCILALNFTCSSGAGSVGLMPANRDSNSDAQYVPSFRCWRLEMKLSPPPFLFYHIQLSYHEYAGILQHFFEYVLDVSGLKYVYINDVLEIYFRTAVDMIGFRVNSVGNHTHLLCWSIIQHHTEFERTYTCTFLELPGAFML
jgi:hypothetical protein